MTIFESVKNSGKSIYLRISYIVVAFLFAFMTIAPAYAASDFTIHATPACNTPSVILGGDLWCGTSQITRMDTSGAAVASYDIRALSSEPTLVVAGITAGLDNNIWFSGYIGSSVKSGQLNISTSTVTLNTIGILDNSPQVSAPVTGSDGAIWFYARARGGTVTRKMIRVEPSTGVATVKHTSDSYSVYSQITKGPDGNPWVVDTYYKRLVSHNTATGAISASYPLPSGITDVTASTFGPSGSFWFIANSSIFKLTTSDGSFTQHPIVSGVLPQRIISGSDGAVWFTDTGTVKKIHRIAMDGVMTEYPTPSSITQLSRLILGPDDAIWFTGNAGQLGRLAVTPDFTTEPASYVPQIITNDNLWAHTAGNIIRMDTSGTTVANYDIQALSGQTSLSISGIAIDSNNNIWFTGVSGNSARAGRINVSTGAIAIYYGPVTILAGQHVSKPVADAHGNIWYHAQIPYGMNVKHQLIRIDADRGTSTVMLTSDTLSTYSNIVAARDDRTWVTDTHYKRLVTKSSTGETVYALPSSVNDTENLAAGVNGNLWFTANGSVYKMTPSGTFTEYPLVSGATPQYLTEDVDGTLWFADNGSTKKISRLATDGSVTDYAVPAGINQIQSLAIESDNVMRFGTSTSSGPVIGRFGY